MEKKKVTSCNINKKKYFEKKITKKNKTNYLNRSYFLKEILKVVNKNDFLISSTSYTHREIYELRKRYNFIKEKIFIWLVVWGIQQVLPWGAQLQKIIEQFVLMVMDLY